MPRTTTKALTVQVCETTKLPKSGVTEIFDAASPGMCLRVSASGARAFVVTTRVLVNGKRVQRRFTLGRFSSEFGLLDARAAASKIVEDARAGRDPRPKPAPESEPEPPARSKTFGSVAEKYIKRECRGLVRGGEIESIIRRELLPSWGDRPIG